MDDPVTSEKLEQLPEPKTVSFLCPDCVKYSTVPAVRPYTCTHCQQVWARPREPGAKLEKAGVYTARKNRRGFCLLIFGGYLFSRGDVIFALIALGLSILAFFQAERRYE